MLFRHDRTGSESGTNRPAGWVTPQPQSTPPPAWGGGGGDDDPVFALLLWQIIGSAAGLGFLTGNWWVFGFALAGLFWLFQWPRIALVLGVVYSTAIGVVVGLIAGGCLNRLDAGVVCGLIAFGIALSLNVEYVRRIQ